MKKFLKYLINPFAGIYLLLNPVYAQHFNFIETDEGILLKYEHQNIFFYQSATKSMNGDYPRANYIHPLYGLSGEILTEDFPEDHLHHRGIFWAWHQLYVNGQRAGDGWECKGIEWHIIKTSTTTKENIATLITDLNWEGELSGVKTVLMHENTTITCRKPSENIVILDFKIRLTPPEDGTKLGGSEDIKGYSGFSVRTKLPDDLVFNSVIGKVEPEETAVQAGGWIDMQGTFAPGLPVQTAITIMCDPDHPSPFHGWILRDKGSMQNAAFPGSDPVEIPKGSTLELNYRLLLHPPGLGAHEIDRIYKESIESE